MTRSRASAKSAGTRFETLMATYLAATVDDRIERRARNGAQDRGDISGLRRSYAEHGITRGGRVVAELKDYGGRLEAGPWLNEVERERTNDGALSGLVIAKRRGTTDPAEQIVIMSVADLVALLIGERP